MKHQPSMATEFHKAKELGMTHVIILLIGKLFRATEAPKDSLVTHQPFYFFMEMISVSLVLVSRF